MATATDIENFETPSPDNPVRPNSDTSSGDPLVLGLPLIAVGALALGLQLVGFVNVSSSGSPLAVLIGASGLGLLLTTAWAASLRTAPVSSPWARGTSLPTAVLGSLAAFFISYATLVLGLEHGWLAVKPSEIQHTVALFQISWLAGLLLLALASVRLPAAFTALFVSFAAALALLLINTLGPSAVAGKLAGIVALLIGAAAGYVFLATASRASGGREYPIGRPIAR
jgi:succinate-acetate transporter protein